MPPKMNPQEKFERELGRRIRHALELHEGYDELAPSKHTRLFLNSGRAAQIATETAMKVVRKWGISFGSAGEERT